MWFLLKADFKILVLILALAGIGFASGVQAQTVELDWKRQFGSGSSDTAQAVAINGDVYVAGSTFGALPGQVSAGDSDVFLQKYDTNGNLIWTRQFGTSSDDFGLGVVASSSTVYVAGVTNGSLPGQVSSGGQDAFARKYDTDGNEVWTRQFGTSSANSVAGISLDFAGVYVAGTTDGTYPGEISSGSSDVFLRKFDTDGNAQWTRQFGTSSVDLGRSVFAGSSGVYVSGRIFGTLPGQSSAGGHDAFVRKYDTNGNEVWTRQFGTSSFDAAERIVADSGGVYVVGDTEGTLPGQASSGESDVFVRKYDTNGNEVWTRQFGTASFEFSSGISVDSNGVYVAGGTEGALPGNTNLGDLDAFVRKYDINGTEVWTHQFGTASFDELSGVTVASGRVYAVGSTDGTFSGQASSGGLDAFLVRLIQDSDGDGIFDEVDTQPATFSNDFSDVGLGGTTTGFIFTRGNQALSIKDATTSSNGVSAVAAASGGAIPAVITACGGALTALLGAGDTVVVTCVGIDIKPGSDPNPINPQSKSRGVIPVAILTSDTFDAVTVDPTTVEFGPAGAAPWRGRGHIQDVDGDGDLDLLLLFRTQDTGIACGNTLAYLTGETFGGQAIAGADSIRTVGCK